MIKNYLLTKNTNLKINQNIWTGMFERFLERNFLNQYLITMRVFVDDESAKILHTAV